MFALYKVIIKFTYYYYYVVYSLAINKTNYFLFEIQT